AQLHQHLRGDALALADEAEQDVLGADVVVSQLQRLAQRQLQDLLGTGGEGDVAGRALLPLPDGLLNLLTDGFQADAEALQSLGSDALALVDEAEQDVLRANVVVVEHPGFFLSQDNHAPCAVGKPLEHVSSLLTERSGRDGSSDPHFSAYRPRGGSGNLQGTVAPVYTAPTGSPDGHTNTPTTDLFTRCYAKRLSPTIGRSSSSNYCSPLICSAYAASERPATLNYVRERGP